MPLKNAYLIVAASFLWLIGGMAIFNRIDPPAQSPLCHFLVWTVLAGFGVIFLAGTGVWAGEGLSRTRGNCTRMGRADRFAHLGVLTGQVKRSQITRATTIEVGNRAVPEPPTAWFPFLPASLE